MLPSPLADCRSMPALFSVTNRVLSRPLKKLITVLCNNKNNAGLCAVGCPSYAYRRNKDSLSAKLEEAL